MHTSNIIYYNVIIKAKLQLLKLKTAMNIVRIQFERFELSSAHAQVSLNSLNNFNGLAMAMYEKWLL